MFFGQKSLFCKFLIFLLIMRRKKEKEKIVTRDVTNFSSVFDESIQVSTKDPLPPFPIPSLFEKLPVGMIISYTTKIDF